MSEVPPPDPNEHSFSEWLKPGVRELRERRGPCPRAEDLVAFHEGALTAEQAVRVREHVEACGLCDAQLGRLEGAAEPSRPVVWRTVWALLKKPIVAYGFVAVLLFPAYRWFVRPAKNLEKGAPSDVNRRPDSDFGVVPVPSLSLDTVRSVSQTQKSQVMRLSGEEKFFLLSFFVPTKAPPSYNYEVIVVRKSETPVVPGQPLKSCDGAGNCFLICNPLLFPAGPYELRVTEATPSGTKKDLSFHFEVTR